jgi:hypothetical protein
MTADDFKVDGIDASRKPWEDEKRMNAFSSQPAMCSISDAVARC